MKRAYGRRRLWFKHQIAKISEYVEQIGLNVVGLWVISLRLLKNLRPCRNGTRLRLTRYTFCDG